MCDLITVKNELRKCVLKGVYLYDRMCVIEMARKEGYDSLLKFIEKNPNDYQQLIRESLKLNG